MIDQKAADLLRRMDTLVRSLSARAAVIEQIAFGLLAEVATSDRAAASRIAGQVERRLREIETSATTVPSPQEDAAVLELLNALQSIVGRPEAPDRGDD